MVINFNMIVLVFMIVNLGFGLVKFLIIDVNSFIYMELVLRIVELNVFMEVCLMVWVGSFRIFCGVYCGLVG